MPPFPMHRYRRYTYDLTDVIEGLRLAARAQLAQDAIEAWILEELRLAFKVQAIDPDETTQKAEAAQSFPGWGKLRHVTLRHLLALFNPMSHEYYTADYADLEFRHAVLTISLYSLTEPPSGGAYTRPSRPRSPRDEETHHHAQRFHGLCRHS